MDKIFSKVLNFVGWETEEEDEVLAVEARRNEVTEQEPEKPKYMQSFSQRQRNKVVNIHSNNQLKVVIEHPHSFDDSQEICEHLKSKKPIVMNLEEVEKEEAQRIVDFLSGSVYALDGNIQKVSNGIFLIAPSNVDILGEVKDDLRGKGVFPWAK
ncbi:MAG: cell division protein SepF [Clostridia bacterium]|jgi:cell division inhibitor SepF